MNHRALFFLLTALLGFALFIPQQSFKYKGKTPLLNYLKGIPRNDDTPSSIWKALVTGDDSGLKAEVKKKYFRQGLGHLFTPSGIHLSTLYPLFKRMNQRWIIYLAIFLLTHFTQGLAALSRVSLTKCTNKTQNNIYFFSGILILEGYFSSWINQPISWVCSWMFLGICWFAPIKSRNLWFFAAQIVLCWIFNQQIAVYSPLTNFIFAIPMALLFPPVLFLSFIPHFFLHDWILNSIEYIDHSLTLLDRVNFILPAFTPHFGHLLLVIAWIYLKGAQRFTLPVLLFLLSAPLDGVRAESVDVSKWESTPVKNAKIIWRNKGVIEFSDGSRCSGNYYKNGWREKCRPPKRKATF